MSRLFGFVPILFNLMITTLAVCFAILSGTAILAITGLVMSSLGLKGTAWVAVGVLGLSFVAAIPINAYIYGGRWLNDKKRSIQVERDVRDHTFMEYRR